MLPEVLAWLAIVPAGFLCLAPAVNQLKHGFGRTTFLMILLFAVLIPVFAFVTKRFALSVNTLLPLMLLICAAAFQMSVRMPLCKSLAVIFGVCTLMAVLENVACLIEAGRHPELGGDVITTEAGLVQLAVNTAAALLLFWPVRKYGSRLIDRLEIRRVWYMTIPLSLVLIALSLVSHPVKFETLFVNNVFRAFVIIILSTLIIWAVQWIVFYLIVTGILDAARREEKMRILEMQGSQYRAMKQYMELSARTRHDFRQSIRTIRNLFQEGNREALGKYIDEYYDALPRTDLKQYCPNSALNALLNHYASEAEENRIRVSFRIDLPEETGVEDVDLCSITGNILDNAITACSAIPEAERRISLTALIRNGNRLFIVATNTFSGEVSRRNGQYLSTGRSGSGIGLKSIRALAEKYGGTAEFSHEGKEFHSDVMLMI